MKKSLLACSLGILVPIPAHAAVTGIVNGNFQAQTPADGGDIQTVTSWYESATVAGGYEDWVFRSSNTATLSGNTTTVLGFSKNTGYVYQQIGTYTSGETITLTGNALKRNVSSSAFTGFNVQLLAGDFSSAADGVALAASVLDTETFTAAGLGLPTGSTNAAGNVSFSATFDAGSGLAPEGSQLWIRIAKTTGTGEVFLDNLVVTAVPEPSIALMGGLGLLVLLRRRR